MFIILICLLLSFWPSSGYAACDVLREPILPFNAYLGDVKLNVHPVQAINDSFTLKASISFSGGCCGGCTICLGFHARRIRATLQIPNELTLLNGSYSQELADVDGLMVGEHTNREAIWVLVGSSKGVHRITVDVTTDNTIPTTKQASREISIVQDLAIGQPLIKPSSPTPDDDVTVSVNISNPLGIGIRNVTLGYIMNPGALPTKTQMHPGVEDRSWFATISEQPEGTIMFYIEVHDINGSSISSPEYTYRVQDPIRIESWYKNTVALVTLSFLAGVSFVALISFTKHRRRRTSMKVGAPTALKKYETVSHYSLLPYNDEFAKSQERKRRLSLLVCLTLGIVLLFLAVYLGQLNEWIGILGG